MGPKRDGYASPIAIAVIAACRTADQLRR